MDQAGARTGGEQVASASARFDGLCPHRRYSPQRNGQNERSEPPSGHGVPDGLGSPASPRSGSATGWARHRRRGRPESGAGPVPPVWRLKAIPEPQLGQPPVQPTCARHGPTTARAVRPPEACLPAKPNATRGSRGLYGRRGSAYRDRVVCRSALVGPDGIGLPVVRRDRPVRRAETAPAAGQSASPSAMPASRSPWATPCTELRWFLQSIARNTGF